MCAIYHKKTKEGNIGSLVTWSMLFLFLVVSLMCDISPSLALLSDDRYSRTDLVVKFRDNLLYIKTDAVPLDEVLKEISHETNVKIVTLGTLREPVTFKSRKIPLDQALIKLIKGKADYMFMYQGPLVLKKAWIFSKNREDEDPKFTYPGFPRRIRAEKSPFRDMESIENRKIQRSMPLEDYFLNAKSSEEQIQVIEMFAELGDQRAIEVLISATKVSDEDVRESACYALGEIGGSRAVEGLVEGLKDGDPWVRASAAESLARLNAQTALSRLLEALDRERNEGARESIQEALDILTHK